MNIDCIIVGAGQAGLCLATMLKTRNINAIIFERDEHIGDVWRKRPDSMRLFTNRKMSQLPGLALTGIANKYPGKNELADYLDAYAKHNELQVLTHQRVCSVSRENNLYTITTDKGKSFSAKCLVNATGANQLVHIPDAASELSSAVVQLTSNQYQRPEQLIDYQKIAIVGDGSSGRQIAKELAQKTLAEITLFCGKPRPFLPSSILGIDIFSWLKTCGLLYKDTNSRIGKILRQRNPIPCNNIKNSILQNLGVHLTTGFSSVKHDRLVSIDGLEHATEVVIWCTGYQDDTSWLTLDKAAGAEGFIYQTGKRDGGRTYYPGLFIVGRQWLSCRGSELLLGSAKDCSRVAIWIENHLNCTAE